MDLAKTILDQLTGDNLEQLSARLGADEATTRRATEAAVPAVLAGLGGLAASDDGAKKLASTLGNLDLGKLASMFGDASGTAQKGGGLLGSLFGESMITGIAEAIGRYAGLDPATTKKLLAMVLPFIMAKIGGAVQGKGGGASGLQRLFAEQSSNISDALPAGLSLADIPGMPSAEGVGRAAEKSVRAARETTRHAAQDTPKLAFAWLAALAALLLVGFALWYMFGPARNTARNTSERVTAMRPEIPDVTDVSAVTKKLSSTFTTAKESLAGIKDAASATAALPRLKELSTTIDGIRNQLDLLPAAGQAAIGKLVGSEMESFQTEAERVLTLPDASNDVKSTLRGIMNKFAGLNLAQVSTDAKEVVASLTSALREIQDPASADAALPKLKDVSSQLDHLQQVQKQMSPGGQTMLAKLLDAARGPLDALITKAITALGTDAAKVKPVIDAIVTKLTNMSQTPA